MPEEGQTMFTTELETLLPELRGFARMLCGDRDLADDIVQNACLKAWTARTSFDPQQGAFKSWMFTIVRNEFLQHARKHKRVESYAPSELENWLTQDCQFSTRASCSDAIKRLFALKPEQRDVFILVVAIGYSYEEAAKICNCEVGTIKSRINRARKQLSETQVDPVTGAEMQGKSHPGFHGVRDIMGYAEALIQRAA